MNQEILGQQAATTTYDEQATKDVEKIRTLRSFKIAFEPRWYISSAFWDGKHFTFGQRDLAGNWISSKQPKNKVLREIPKAKKQLKNIRNMILKLQRKPVVYPDKNVMGTMEMAAAKVEEEHAIQQGRIIQYYWDEVIKVKRYFPKIVRLAQLHAHSFAQILNHGDGKYELEILDAFDGSCYPTITAMKDHKRFVKHVARTIDQIRENPDYDQAKVEEAIGDTGEGKYSNSSYKQDLMANKYGKADKNNVIIDELYEIVRVPKETEPVEPGEDEVPDSPNTDAYSAEDQTNPNEFNERLRIASYIKEYCIGEQLVPLSRLPQAIFVWDDEAYETSLMEDLMPGNKSYDILVSKLEMKAKKLDTGRLVVQKGEDAKVITTDDGEIIRWKRVRPEVMQEAPLSNTFMEALNLLDSDLKEQGIAISSGADIPSGIRAWHAIESLKESDYASLGTQMDNFDSFIVELTEALIEMVAYDTVDIQMAQIRDQKGKYQHIKYIGKRGADIYKQTGFKLPSDVVVIDPNRTVKVEVESSITWTETAKKDVVMEIANTMVTNGTPLPPDVILDLLNVGNTRDIVEQIKVWQTFGKSMLDMPDFKVLPIDLQRAIAAYLSAGATMPGQQPGGNPQDQQIPVGQPPQQQPQPAPSQSPSPQQGQAPWAQ